MGSGDGRPRLSVAGGQPRPRIDCAAGNPARSARFSDLREQIRNRRMATGCASDRDLFETERFILDEVLQLICDRVQAITQADGVVIALAEGSDAQKSQLVCRAAAGTLA